jgi:tetratricopeptide (TPR) repeat protein
MSPVHTLIPVMNLPNFAPMLFPPTRKFRHALLLALCCAGGTFLAPLAPAQDNAALIERARLANDQRQFDQSRADLAVVLARSPWNEGALLEQARLLYFERKPEEAWKTVNALLGEYPRNATALNLRGLLNLEWKKDNNAALADFTSAVQHDPKLAKAFINRARTLLTLKRPAEALEDADAAIELEPESSTFRWIRGLTFIQLKQPVRGLENFNDAIDLNPDDAETRVRRAILIQSLIEPTTRTETFEAMKLDIDRALELVPDHPEALLLLGQYHEFKEDPAAAFDSYCRAYRKTPNDARVWQSLQRTSRSQFEEGRDPARVYQLLDDAKAAFVRSDYALQEALYLGAIFDFIPPRVADTNPARLRKKDYLDNLLRSHPDNLRLLYHVHAGIIDSDYEQPMRTVARDYDPAKDKDIGVLATLQVASILRNRGDGQTHPQDAVRLYKEAGEWLAKAVELEPNSDRVKRAVAEYYKLTKAFAAERTAEAKTSADMVTQFESLTTRFRQARDYIERTDAIAAQHMAKAQEILRTSQTANRGDLNRSLTYKQRAWDAKKGTMTGVDQLIKDLDAYRYRFPNALKKNKDWTIEARNYLENKRREYASMQDAMK